MAGSRFVGSPLMFGFGTTVERAYAAPLTLSEPQRTQLYSRDAVDRTLGRELGADGVCVGGAGVRTDADYVRIHEVTEGRSAVSEGDDRSFFHLRLVERHAEAAT
jgi:hypothetical protein